MTNLPGPAAGHCLRRSGGSRFLISILVFVLSFSTGSSAQSGSPAGGEQSRQGMLRRFEACLENGAARRREGYYREAIQLFSEAHDLARELADPESEVRCLMLLGRMNWAAGLPEVSQRLYSEALEGARSHSLKEEIAECRTALEIGELYARGKAEREARQTEKSVQNFRTAIELAVQSGIREYELKCLRLLGVAQLEGGDVAASLTANLAALQVARELNDRREQVKCLTNIGVIHLAAKEYTKALNCFSDGQELSRAIGASPDESICLRNIVPILMDLGFIERAVDYLEAVQEIEQQAGSAFFLPQRAANLGVAIRNKALVLGAKEDLYRAYDCLSGALDLACEYGDKRTEWLALNTLGNVCLDLKKYSAALHYFESSLAVSEKDPDPLSMMEILTNTGICQLELGNAEKAIGLFEEALALGKRFERDKILWEPLFHLGRCYEKIGVPQQALACYRSSVEAIEHIRSQVLVEDYRVGFGRGKLKVYESLIAILSDLAAAGTLPGGEEEVFLTAEKAKARAFLESLGDFKNDLRSGQPASLRKKERDISSRITDIIEELSRKELNGDAKRKWRQALQIQEDEYLRLVSRMRAEAPEAAEVIFPLQIRLNDVQELLPDERTAILEYFLAAGRSYLFLITKKEFTSLPLAPQEEIENSLRAYLNLLSQSPQGRWEGGFAAAQLSRGLLFPALEHLPASIEHLIIVPDGYLCYLPFETLPPLPSDGPPRPDFLISRYSISYAPSCSALLSLQRKKMMPEYPKDFLAFGNPDYSPDLAGRKTTLREVSGMMKDIYEDHGFRLSPLGRSEKEIRKVSGRFPENRKDIYFEKNAREDVLKSIPLDGYRIIHFACHAFVDDRVPFRSGLFLSLGAVDGEDGFVQSREIASLRINAVLVVLSACQTSRGYLEKGEGIMGLTRVFFYSGARSVVSALWEIEDRAAAEFMGHFYGDLSRGKPLSQALRLAKLRMLESKYAHPFYWAPFILNGEPFSRIDFH
jgi:CHAT domain-containing protein